MKVKSVAAIPAPSAITVELHPIDGPHLDRFGGEARDQVKAPVRGCIHLPITVASCPRCHIVEHRENMVMPAAKSGHYSGSE
jgi:hypothetical protein